ncbi:MAG: hypothetical protein ACOC6D_01850 [Atribacterota bacterium]
MTDIKYNKIVLNLLKILYFMILFSILFFNNSLLAYQISIDSPNLDILWEKKLGGEDYEAIRDLISIPNNHFITVGSSGSSGKPWESIWILKGNEDGEIVADKIIGENYYNSGNVIISAPDEHLLIGGEKNWLYCSSCHETGEAWIAMVDYDLNIKWEKSFNLEGNSSILAMSPSEEEGFGIAGLSQIDGSGLSNAWFAYVDWQGNIIWSKIYDYLYQDKATSMLDLGKDGFLISGYSQTSNLSKSTAWILKTNKQGKIEWKKEFETNKGINALNRIIKSDANKFIAVGYTSAKGAGWQDGWVVKIDENGELLWEKTFGGENKDVFNTIIRETDNYIITGTTNTPGKDASDGWVVKIDENGELLWEKTFGGENKDVSHGSHAQSNNTFYLFGSSSPPQQNSINEDGWIVKVNIGPE